MDSEKFDKIFDNVTEILENNTDTDLQGFLLLSKNDREIYGSGMMSPGQLALILHTRPDIADMVREALSIMDMVNDMIKEDEISTQRD